MHLKSGAQLCRSVTVFKCSSVSVPVFCVPGRLWCSTCRSSTLQGAALARLSSEGWHGWLRPLHAPHPPYHQPALHCNQQSRQKKSQSNVTSVSVHYLKQVIWRHIWNHIVGKSKTNITPHTLLAHCGSHFHLEMKMLQKWNWLLPTFTTFYRASPLPSLFSSCQSLPSQCAAIHCNGTENAAMGLNI